MARKIIKVVWICGVSNPKLRSHLNLSLPLWRKVLNILQHKKNNAVVPDLAIWNTNALKEFESIDDVELHVIFTHPKMRKNTQCFEDNCIKYYAVNEGDTSLFCCVKNKVFSNDQKYFRTWRNIEKLVKKIQPDIIHLMGAENPPYSLSITRFPQNIPVIVQLQTVLHDPKIVNTYPELASQKKCEYIVLNKADYIGTKSTVFPSIVRKYVKETGEFVNTKLIIAEKPDLSIGKKEFDYVYFSSYINKAIDLAIEAFGIVYKKRPDLTLDVVGGASEEELSLLTKRIKELGLINNVFFEGKLPTHDDVLSQIKKARFALLPLKTDVISSTIREAMWSGLPVITTITSGTPRLNEKRLSVLLSETGDHKALADNMLKVLNENLANDLKNNAIVTVEEMYGNNHQRAKEWVEVYCACIQNYHNGTPLPDNIKNNN